MYVTFKPFLLINHTFSSINYKNLKSIKSQMKKNDTEISHASSPSSGMLNRKLGKVFSLMCTLGLIQISELQFVIAILNLLSCENALYVSVSDKYKNKHISRSHPSPFPLFNIWMFIWLFFFHWPNILKSTEVIQDVSRQRIYLHSHTKLIIFLPCVIEQLQRNTADLQFYINVSRMQYRSFIFNYFVRHVTTYLVIKYWHTILLMN